MERFRRFVTLASLGLVVAALIVPYDFRVPTFERARSRWWNTDDDRVFVPQVFGVGWTVNLARVAKLVRLV